MRSDLAFLFERRNRYRAVFDTPDGRKVLADLMTFCHVDRPVTVPGDAQMSAYNDGMRRVALRIASILRMKDEEIFALANQGREQNDAEV